jgi:hypothetical protein
MVLGIGGILLVISLFLSWASAFGASASAFDLFSGMDIIMLVIGIAAVAYAASVAAGSSARAPSGSPLILAALGLVVLGWALGWDIETSGAGVGSWLALIASAAITYGAFTSQRELGLP